MIRRAFLLTLVLLPLLPAGVRAAEKPNVLVIITDDQGYGDLACHGNETIKTPNLDKLHAESVRLTNYHVDPTCSPTRSALMTGRYSTRTGVWHTIMGRSMMHPDEFTLGEMFAANGYRTAMFGKWHLGDNAPLRPEDQGFDHVFHHGGGGVGQTPDYWDNSYFDDTYYKDGKWQPHEGYCTDIWFDGAIDFVTADSDKPFFAYLSTNAPHGPFNVSPKYSEPYEKLGVPKNQAKFWGMITNIDENVGKLRKVLAEKGLAENTILVFTTDNGTAAGAGGPKGFNAGMRGQKGSEYDGGHRVPFFVHWPQGELTGGRDLHALSAHVDVLPTLAELCGLKVDPPNPLDGTSLARLLGDAPSVDWPDRTLLVHSQRVETPQKWRKSAVMTQRWRFVNGKELYDMTEDPGQKKDVAADHPEVVEKLTGEYEAWWKSIGTRFGDYVRIDVGSKAENPAHLTCHDWHTNNRAVPWNHGHIRRDLVANGYWAVNVTEAGQYRITLRNRPAHVKHPLNATSAEVSIESGGEGESSGMGAGQSIDEGATEVSFDVELPAGPAKLTTTLTGKDGKKRGAYFVEIERQ